MPIANGTQLGPYEILGPIGAGGMGEVFRARDTRLGREVAIKVLPEAFARDAERLRRFEQEARVIAALNHPNIVGIYDIGHSNGLHYVVMELVDGESLRAVLSRGALPTRKLIDSAVQVADGLAAAHTAGIVHRDLKPENIMFTRDSRVKILDFGLAKQAAAASDATQVSEPTQAGTVLGTTAYMSPEQARGQAVDFRSDLFSFGLVLYEMASGKKAFQRDSAPQTMSAIIAEDAPPMEAKIPPPLKWAIERCLEKEPSGRHESTRDLYQELRYLREHLSEAFTTSTAASEAAPRRRRPTWVNWLIPAAIGLVAGALLILFLVPAPPMDLSRVRHIPLIADEAAQGTARWSPDGKSIAYQARVGANNLFVRRLDSPVGMQITRFAEGVSLLSWSPDSRQIFFYSKHAPAGVWAVSAAGGEPESVLAIKGQVVTSVSPDGRVIATLRRDNEVIGNISLWISSPSGSPLQKYSPAPFETAEVYNNARMRFAPDGRNVLLMFAAKRGTNVIEERWLIPVPAGSGQPHRILEQLPADFTPSFSWMPDSRTIVASLPLSGANHLWLANISNGQIQQLTNGSGEEGTPDVSPDGKRVAYTLGLNDFDLMQIPVDAGPVQTLLGTGRGEMMASWSPAAPQFAFVTDKTGQYEIWLKNQQDGSLRPLVTAADFGGEKSTGFMDPVISPDGTRVVYTRVGTMGSHLWISSLAGSSPVRVTNDEIGSEWYPTWSPDGNWIAYGRMESGKVAVAKARIGSRAAPEILRPQTFAAVWSPRGDWIVCDTDKNQILLSPDGKNSRDIAVKGLFAAAFARDGKTLYGLRGEGPKNYLSIIDVDSGREKSSRDLGDLTIGSPLNPAIFLSLSPDGKSLATTSIKIRSEIWVMEGFEPPSLLSRLGLRKDSH